ncbi:fasciclin-2 isoform X2 [Venturia canescens]|uniref:fasciclin-2 isoform X2 n=1 Tax=Venturia canescens TaxID=32260 RepID=UPI001C9D634C|nr:fasciclin-2 isoform X2 [Venturia canescens]
MAASGIPIVVLVLLHLAASGNAASLEILPTGDLQRKPIDSKLIMTCKGKGEQITNLQWLDRDNRPIEARRLLVLPIESDSNDDAGGTGEVSNPHMWTESHPPNSLMLYIYSLKENQAGKYTCVATYANTETLEQSVTIEAIDSIKWIDAPEDQYPILGKDFKIKCHVSAKPSPTVDWLHDGKRIETGDHYVIETHALTIKKVVESDEGIYTCRALVIPTGEVQERAIRVEVLEEPKIEETHSEIEIVEGKTETITCKASGKPPPKYTWVKYLTREDLSTTDRFGVDKDLGLLTITNVNREDGGEYQCTANNTAGQAQTIIKVSVIGKPKIMEFFNRTSSVGKTVEITCKAFGRPSPEVFFRKHTSANPYKIGIQSDDDRITLSSIPDNAKGETVASLSIENVLRDDDGLYECIAKNKVATAYKNGHLTVEFPPSFASMNNKTVWSWDQRPVNLTCIAESIPNATIRWTMNGNRPIDTNDPMYQQIGSGPISTLMVKPFDQRYYAIYKCHAENIHGSREHTITLKEAEKPGFVQQARMAEITATTIAFTILPPPTQPELPLRTITVQYKEELEPWTAAKNRTWSIGSPYVLENLKPQTQYQFQFRARNDVGDGNWGANLVETTPQRNFPNPPRIQVRSGEALYEVSPFTNQYQLQWHAPPDNGEPIDMYEIRYCEVKRLSGNDWDVMEGTCIVNEIKGQRTKELLKRLKSNSYYLAEVRAHNIIGYSNPGFIYFRTAEGENMPLVHKGPLISSAAIIGIVIAALFLLIVIVDIICCCTYKIGIIYYVCERSRKKPMDEEDTKLGSLYGWRFPLPYCDQKMANVAGVTAIQDSGSGKNTIKLVKHTAM